MDLWVFRDSVFFVLITNISMLKMPVQSGFQWKPPPYGFNIQMLANYDTRHLKLMEIYFVL